MSKHTAGPWSTVGTMTLYVEARIPGGLIQEVAAVGPTEAYGGYGEQQRANARLIAAAPDLLEALDSLIKGYVGLLEAGMDRITSLGGDCDPVPVMEQNDPWLRDARAAITKATGEAR